jgi:myo-inositol 2-dehydrogenase/D-chiro-inositol 1-dehydrogenase
LAEAFVAALNGGPATGLTLEDAREATRIGIAMRESLAKGEAVNF